MSCEDAEDLMDVCGLSEIQHAGTWKIGQTTATRKIDVGINDHTWPFSAE
jgi:hypothetical protein